MDADDAIDRALALLAEHFDTVQIFATRHDPDTGQTVGGHWGTGNAFAREGQVAEWLALARSRARRDARSEEG